MIHIPPDPHILDSMRNTRLPWWQAIAELIDNSLDAGAKRIAIDVAGRVLTVSDDGRGCEDVTSLFRLGEHKPSRGGRDVLGRYGVGAKDAWLSCSDTMEVETQRNGIVTRMRVNCDEWAANNWCVPDPVRVAAARPGSGTTIKMPLRPGKNTPCDDVFGRVAYVFTPALESGIQIVRTVRGKTMLLMPSRLPMRTDIVQAEFDVNGKGVQIDIGILPDGVTVEYGPLRLIYGHRIIETTSIGAGQYSVARVCGTIRLGSGWALAKNKDSLTESQDALADAIFSRIEHVLKKADKIAESIESAALRGDIQDAMNAAVRNATGRRERRGKGDSVGAVEPQHTRARRIKADKTHDAPGSVETTACGRKGGYILDWCETDAASMGMFDRAGMRVSLNTNNGFIRSAKAAANRPALVACAFALVADHACRHDRSGQSLLRFNYSDFSEAMGTMAGDYQEVRTSGKA